MINCQIYCVLINLCEFFAIQRDLLIAISIYDSMLHFRIVLWKEGLKCQRRMKICNSLKKKRRNITWTRGCSGLRKTPAFFSKADLDPVCPVIETPWTTVCNAETNDCNFKQNFNPDLLALANALDCRLSSRNELRLALRIFVNCGIVQCGNVYATYNLRYLKSGVWFHIRTNRFKVEREIVLFWRFLIWLRNF